jgi:hypothetical protein
MKTISILSTICLLSLQLVGPLDTAAQSQPLQLHLGSSIIGSNLKNPQGKDLGKVKDLVVNADDNRVVYAVVSFGGVLGVGEKLFAVPLSALKRAAEANTFILEIDQERLQNAPEFNQHNWPQMTDSQWITSVYTFYGLQPYGQP